MIWVPRRGSARAMHRNGTVVEDWTWADGDLVSARVMGRLQLVG